MAIEIKNNNAKSKKSSIIKDRNTQNKKRKKIKIITNKNHNLKNMYIPQNTGTNKKSGAITPIDNNTKPFTSRTTNFYRISRKKFNHRITKRRFRSLKRGHKTNNFKKAKNIKKENFQFFLNKKLSIKYNTNTNNFYSFKKINEILYNIPSHFSAYYKELIVDCDENEFITQFYKRQNIKQILPKLLDFYNSFSVIFPNYMTIPEGVILNDNIIEKQKMIDKLQRMKEIEENNKNIKNKEDSIFSSSVLKSIFTDNDLKDIMSIDDDKIANENIVNTINCIKKYEYNIIPVHSTTKKSKKNFGLRFSFVDYNLKKNKSKNLSTSKNSSKQKNRNNSYTIRSQNILKKSFFKNKILNSDFNINDTIYEINHTVGKYGTFRKLSSKQRSNNLIRNKKNPSANYSNNKIANHTTIIKMQSSKKNYNTNPIREYSTMKSNHIQPKNSETYTNSKRNKSNGRNTIIIDSEKIKSKLLKKIKPRENKLYKNMMTDIITDIRKRSNRKSQNITVKKNIMLYKKKHFDKNNNKDSFCKNIGSLNFNSINFIEEEKNISSNKYLNTDRNNYTKEKSKNQKLVNSFYNNNTRLSKISEKGYSNFRNSIENNIIFEFNIRDNYENKNNYSIRKYYKNVKNIKLNEENKNRKKKFNVTKEKSEGKKNTIGYDYDSGEASRNLRFIDEFQNISKRFLKDSGNCNKYNSVYNSKNLNRFTNKNPKKKRK